MIPGFSCIAFCPFIALFGEDGSDESDQRLTIGEDRGDIGAGTNFRFSRSLGLSAERDPGWSARLRW